LTPALNAIAMIEDSFQVRTQCWRRHLGMIQPSRFNLWEMEVKLSHGSRDPERQGQEYHVYVIIQDEAYIISIFMHPMPDIQVHSSSHSLSTFFCTQVTMLAPSSRFFTRALPVRTLPTLPFRRPISTAPPSRKSRSWKSSATRWGLALGGIYYYNNSDIFAEEPPCLSPPSPAHAHLLCSN
jgi:hypothetical protein